MDKVPPARRQEIARKAAAARWKRPQDAAAVSKAASRAVMVRWKRPQDWAAISEVMRRASMVRWAKARRKQRRST